MIEKQNCPLCGKSADFKLIDHRDKKYFNCQCCGRFVITRSIEKEIINQSSNWLKEASSRANSLQQEKILFITAVDYTILKTGEQKYPIQEIKDSALFLKDVA